jgi:hypothetical protein
MGSSFCDSCGAPANTEPPRSAERSKASSRLVPRLLTVVVVLGLVGIGGSLAVTQFSDGDARPKPEEALRTAPIPTAQIARDTATYLSGPGQVLARQDLAASGLLVLSPTTPLSDCQSAGKALQAAGSPAEVLTAVASIPDPVLRELVLGEHAARLALLRACGTADAETVESLVSEANFLHDAVAARKAALGAAA